MKLTMRNGAEIEIGDVQKYQGNDMSRVLVDLTAEEDAAWDEAFGTTDIGEDCE